MPALDGGTVPAAPPVPLSSDPVRHVLLVSGIKGPPGSSSPDSHSTASERLLHLYPAAKVNSKNGGIARSRNFMLNRHWPDTRDGLGAGSGRSHCTPAND